MSPCDAQLRVTCAVKSLCVKLLCPELGLKFQQFAHEPVAAGSKRPVFSPDQVDAVQYSGLLKVVVQPYKEVYCQTGG